MNATAMPTWLRFSERAFAFNFIAFSFVMFSCWFPTGFSATFSTLALVFALPVFVYNIKSVNLSLFEKAGLMLFGWLMISVLWSSTPTVTSIGFLLEYRIYFFLPIFITVLAPLEKTQLWAFRVAVLGAFIALITSYGLGFGWWTVDGAELSLANRIYHGFVMSSLLVACFFVIHKYTGSKRLLAFAVALLVTYNVANIETGRTGYLLITSLWFIFAFSSFSSFSRLVALITIPLVLAFITLNTALFESLDARLNQTVFAIERAINHDEFDSSVGRRLEFYRGAGEIAVQHPLLGLGVGDVEATLREKTDLGELRFSTDNVHSEFLNMLLAGGLPAMLMLVGFIIAVIKEGLVVKKIDFALSQTFIGIGMIVCVSGLFNSIIKDYGEKHALLIILPLLATSFQRCCRNLRTEKGGAMNR